MFGVNMLAFDWLSDMSDEERNQIAARDPFDVADAFLETFCNVDTWHPRSIEFRNDVIQRLTDFGCAPLL